MAESLLIKDIAIVTENEVIKNGYVGINDGKISTVSTERPKEPYSKEIQAPADSVLLPGMIDIHIHGGYGADTMDASFSTLDIMSSRLPEEGTTSFLATTITQEHGNISQASLMSVPRPAMLVAIVTAPFWPASSMICASRSWFLAFNT